MTKPNTAAPQLISVAQAATYLAVSPRTVRLCSAIIRIID